MAKKEVNGVCHICGKSGKLTFEHVPPKSAFNNRKVIQLKFEDYITLGPDEKPKGKQEQRGSGAYTLCGKCNNNIGLWYGKTFVSWCYQGMDILQATGGNPSLIYMNYLFPLSIVKHIITMFLSVNSNTFRKFHPELVSFILNKQERNLSPKYRIYVYYNLSSLMRFHGAHVSGDIFKGKLRTFSEITYPPFGYVMTFNSEPPDERLFDITHFAKYEYGKFVVLNLRLPVMEINTPYPGDYRSKKEIKAQILKDTISRKTKKNKK